MADFALANSIVWYGNFSFSLLIVIYLGVAVAILSLNIGTSCKFLNVSQCFWSTFVAFIWYSAPSNTTIVEYFISYFSIKISFIFFILSSTEDVSPIVLKKSCKTLKLFACLCKLLNSCILRWICTL